MGFDPKNFFIGIIDFFSVLMPGALLTYLLTEETGNNFLDKFHNTVGDIPIWLGFLFSAYVLGHFIFLVGALLDDLLYERIRNATPGQENKKRSAGKSPSFPLARLLAKLLVKDESDEAQFQASAIKEYYVNKLGPQPGINAFQWSKARLVLENRTEAIATVLRFEADSKFFRSFSVVIFIFIVWSLYNYKFALTVVYFAFMLLALLKYFQQRLKAANQAYWYIATIEAADTAGYRQPQPSPAAGYRHTQPSRAGGVVYRNSIEYLIVQAKRNADEWVLPKGHIEPNESMRAAAAREVLEETGIRVRIESDLGTTSFELGDEHVKTQFYLMEAVGAGEPQERREMRWLPWDRAVELATHEESKKILRKAHSRLNTDHPGAAPQSDL